VERALLIWAAAQDVRFFIVAAALNGTVPHLAHRLDLLMVEDAEERHLVHIWTWVTLFGIGSAFVTPLGGWFVARFGLVPAMRGLAVFGCLMLTTKAFVLYLLFPRNGARPAAHRRNPPRSLLSLLGEYRSVFRAARTLPPYPDGLSLMVITNIYATVHGSFWGVLFTSKLGFAESEISLYVALRSIVMALCFFLIGPRLTNLQRFRLPLWLGFAAFFISQTLLVFMPPHAIPLLVLSVVLEAVAAALVNPMTESLLAVSMESHERARLSAIVYVALLVATSPFGWIAGQLSALDRSLPFVLNMGLL
jgi:Na+/melibiose symporter-like transporter